jgi:putative ABC transport system permease protein
VTSLRQEFRFALRTFANRPAYALITIGVLAFAIGANTTVFSIFSAFLLRPLPYPDDARLVSVYNIYPKSGPEAAGTSIPDYLDRREQAPSLADLAIVTRSARTVTGGGRAEQLSVVRASPSLFSVLGMAPTLGRVFTDDEATPGKDDVAVLSTRLWRTRFGGETGVIGRELRLDGRQFRIIGVMPQAFSFPDRNTDVWLPFAFTIHGACRRSARRNDRSAGAHARDPARHRARRVADCMCEISPTCNSCGC